MKNPDFIFYLINLSVFIIGIIVGFFWNKYLQQQKIALLKEKFLEEKNNYEQKIHLLQKEFNEYQLTTEKLINDKANTFSNEKHQLEKNFLNRTTELEKTIEQQKIQLKNWEEKWKNAQENFKEKEETLRKEFELLAQRILEEKTKKFTEVNQNNMLQILTPFQEAMKVFKEKLEQNEKESHGRHTALQQQLRELQQLNQRLSQEALNLTKALKGESKTQGIWGETILNRLLEKSGLEKGREYFVQQSYQAAENTNRLRVQPDVVIHLPDNKKLIIDAKVSLTAYERYINTENEKEQADFLKQHIISIKKHINNLAQKSYDELLQNESPEFILLFIPIETAFSLALKEDNSIYNYAFDRNIVMVTPSTLLATLKIVDNMWRNEKQRQNTFEIAKQAGALYDKFYGLINDLEQIGVKITAAYQSYEKAMNKLHTGKGNLISRVQKLKELGAKTKKQLPEHNK